MTTARRATLAEIGPRQFETVEAGALYRLTVPGADVVFEVDRLTWHKHELSGELLVRCDLAGTDAVDGVLSVATFNLSSARARSERARLLKDKSRSPDVPWEALVEELCQRTLAAERAGDPATDFRDIAIRPEEDRELRVFGFRFPKHHASILFGDGGACKSYLGLYLGALLAGEGYRVGLFDWELDGEDHRERLGRLFGDGIPANFLYTRCNRPLVHEADRLGRIVRRQGIDFAIYDSIGFACHEAPETAEAALAYFRAVRQIGVGSLHLAHVSKAEGGDQKPFGSTYFHNSARATWNLKPAEEGTDELTVGVFCRKANLGAKQPPFSIAVDFSGGRTTFRHTDIGAVSEFVGKVPLAQRIKSVLKDGSRTREEVIARFPDEKPETVRRVIDREIGRDRLVQFPTASGEKHIGLAARRTS